MTVNTSNTTSVKWEFIIVPDNGEQPWFHGYRSDEEAARKHFKHLNALTFSKGKVEVYKVVSIHTRHPADFTT